MESNGEAGVLGSSVGLDVSACEVIPLTMRRVVESTRRCLIISTSAQGNRHLE
jgi:hypothetical protein